MLRQIELDVETRERTLLQAGHLVNLSLGEYLAAGFMFDMRQWQKTFWEDTPLTDFLGW
jgi:hypothetical protein